MSTMTLSAPAPAFRAGTALFLAVAMAATVGSALAFQYVGESAPGKEGKPIAMNITCPKK